jgi:hypothetical protein
VLKKVRCIQSTSTLVPEMGVQEGITLTLKEHQVGMEIVSLQDRNDCEWNSVSRDCDVKVSQEEEEKEEEQEKGQEEQEEKTHVMTSPPSHVQLHNASQTSVQTISLPQSHLSASLEVFFSPRVCTEFETLGTVK